MRSKNGHSAEPAEVVQTRHVFALGDRDRDRLTGLAKQAYSVRAQIQQLAEQMQRIQAQIPVLHQEALQLDARLEARIDLLLEQQELDPQEVARSLSFNPDTELLTVTYMEPKSAAEATAKA